jgi:uncharacterized protein YdeI (BOF family)
MKKIIALAVTLVMVFAMAVSALAVTPGTANQNSKTSGSYIEQGYTVVAHGNGNALAVSLLLNGQVMDTTAGTRLDNKGTYTLAHGNWEFRVTVQGNKISNLVPINTYKCVDICADCGICINCGDCVCPTTVTITFVKPNALNEIVGTSEVAIGTLFNWGGIIPFADQYFAGFYNAYDLASTVDNRLEYQHVWEVVENGMRTGVYYVYASVFAAEGGFTGANAFTESVTLAMVLKANDDAYVCVEFCEFCEICIDCDECACIEEPVAVTVTAGLNLNIQNNQTIRVTIGFADGSTAVVNVLNPNNSGNRVFSFDGGTGFLTVNGNNVVTGASVTGIDVVSVSAVRLAASQNQQ